MREVPVDGLDLGLHALCFVAEEIPAPIGAPEGFDVDEGRSYSAFGRLFIQVACQHLPRGPVRAVVVRDVSAFVEPFEKVTLKVDYFWPGDGVWRIGHRSIIQSSHRPGRTS